MNRVEEYGARISGAKTTVVKLGTRLLTDSGGKLNISYMESLIKVLADLKLQGRNIIIVSSGAIGAGIGRLNMPRRPSAIPDKQAAAAVGQGLLLQYYEKFFSRDGIVVAQILLTRDDLVDRKRYINACNTILTLLKWGVVPIINENDSVSVEEIKFGDNDRLSSLVAGLVDAELLLLFTDIEGLYSGNPLLVPDAKMIDLVEEITPEIKEYAGNTKDDLATGGMITKIQAAEIAVNSGVDMIIADGRDPHNLYKIYNGENIGTLFVAKNRSLCRRKRWIAYGRLIEGELTIDDGAKDALINKGKSLLAIGVKAVQGTFAKGDMVIISDLEGNEVGRGLVNFTSSEVKKILMLPSPKIKEIIGEGCKEEIIHRDDMVLYL